MLIRLSIVFVLSVFTLVCQGDTGSDDPRKVASEEVWNKNIKPAYFYNKKIFSSEREQIIKLKVPPRAEDASIVPVSIQFDISDDKPFRVSKLYFFVDKNPSPLVGVFEFPEKGGKADLALRIKVNDFSFVRAIAEMDNGEFYMAKSFVKAAGGCSAPAGIGQVESMGKMKTRIMGQLKLAQPNLLQLKIKHPNFSGLEIPPPGVEKPKPHYIKSIKAYFDDALVFKADLTFSISIDPSFRFYIVPQEEGILLVEAVDTKDNVFTHKHIVDNNNISIN